MSLKSVKTKIKSIDKTRYMKSDANNYTTADSQNVRVKRKAPLKDGTLRGDLFR